VSEFDANNKIVTDWREEVKERITNKSQQGVAMGFGKAVIDKV
jgi:hypothetical protein